MSFARRMRRLQAHEVQRHKCKGCGRIVILYKGNVDKVSHETPICDWFRQGFAAICAKHGLDSHEGAPYLAGLIDPSKPEGTA